MKSALACLCYCFALGCAAQDLPVEVTPITLNFEAGAAFYEDWPSGKTIHSGVGYIKPFGSADYSCGVDYAESKDFPSPAGAHDWLVDHSIDKNPLFCVYRLATGDIYAWDYLVGHAYIVPEQDGRNSEVVNIVVGGSGQFTGASGVWVGTTDGRGQVQPIREDLSLPQSIMKLMDGYIRIAQ